MLKLAPLAFAVLAVIAPVASAGEITAPSGDYLGKGDGVDVAVTVASGSDAAKLTYAMRTRCGGSKGVVVLAATSAGTFKGKWASRSGKRSAKVLIEPLPGTKLSGTIRFQNFKAPSGKPAGRNAGKPKRCRARRNFLASYDFAIKPDEARADVGHYAGVGSEGGHPVEFDVTYGKARPDALQISNLAFETDVECWEDLDDDGNDDTLVAKVESLSGEIDSDGDFYIDERPGEDAEYEIEGTLRDGRAKMEIAVGGYWAADGTPMLDEGLLECDSWGETYTAAKEN